MSPRSPAERPRSSSSTVRERRRRSRARNPSPRRKSGEPCSMVSHGEAFAPGHITAFFVGYDDLNPYRKGSRGAGLCTTLGVHTVARAREDRTQSIEVFINDEPAKAESTARAAQLLLGSTPYEVKI